MLPYLVHLGYFLMLCALLAREVLVLRSVLVAAQAVIAIYALSVGVLAIAGWNVLFVSINLVWIVLILRERRRVQVPAELQPIYAQHFSALTPREFLRWWQLGQHEGLCDVRLTWSGQYPEWLYFLLRGTVRVSRSQATVTELQAGFFVGEMSLITGQPATADADALGGIEVRQWATSDLHSLRDRDPVLWIKVQSAIGLDLVEKIRRGDERLAER